MVYLMWPEGVKLEKQLSETSFFYSVNVRHFDSVQVSTDVLLSVLQCDKLLGSNKYSEAI